jgi:hypothetical protein
VAQQLLAVVLRSYPPSVISELPDVKTVRTPILLLQSFVCAITHALVVVVVVVVVMKVLEALIPFTDRQLEYVNRQLQNSYMIDYTLQSINLLLEEEDGAGEEGPVGALGKRKERETDTTDADTNNGEEAAEQANGEEEQETTTKKRKSSKKEKKTTPATPTKAVAAQ